MKGLVFTEFIEMMENDFGFEVADRVIENSDTISKGVFTGVGTYPLPGHGGPFNPTVSGDAKTGQ